MVCYVCLKWIYLWQGRALGKPLLLLDLTEDFFLLPLDLLHLFIVALAHEPLKVVSLLRCAVQNVELVGVERSLGPD